MIFYHLGQKICCFDLMVFYRQGWKLYRQGSVVSYFQRHRLSGLVRKTGLG
jgi:hypothetical protein